MSSPPSIARPLRHLISRLPRPTTRTRTTTTTATAKTLNVAPNTPFALQPRLYTTTSRLRASNGSENGSDTGDTRRGGGERGGGGPSLFQAGPAPPRLPESEQRIFEELQRRSTGAFSTARAAASEALPEENHGDIEKKDNNMGAPVAAAATATAASAVSSSELAAAKQQQGKEGEEKENTVVDARVAARGDGEELHPDVRRGARPEFEGDRNPRTGEVGGPKNDPLRWGGNADWSFNGRATDF